YHIHTDAIRDNLIPPDLSKIKQNLVYANEADLLNLALFGKTAKQWRDENTDIEGNIRDYATIEQLIVLSNLESLNSVFIKQDISGEERLILLNKTAIEQMRVLISHSVTKKLQEHK
ncbi:MAG: KilA-N domain-containing protein, partial [FCB group bacterium]